MESGRSHLARAAGESSAAAASAGAGKAKKNSAFSHALILASEGPQAAVTETTSAWTGQKKTKIQSTPTSGEHSSGKIAGGQEREEIDGLDWDDEKLEEELDGCLLRLKDPPFLYYAGVVDNESFIFLDEQQRKVLNQRLALCRIRAHEEKYQDMDDETLSGVFPHNDLEANEYYLSYELSFEWYFDPVYCQYVLQDYQRLIIQNNGEYEDWEYYHSICSTLECDKEYVQFWERLSSKSEFIQWYITRRKTKRTYESRTESLLHYHTLKTAEPYPHIYKTLVNTGCMEFRRSLKIDFISSRLCADFLFEMWKLLAVEKLSFKDALMHVYNNEKYFYFFPVRTEFLRNLRPLEKLYKPFLDGLCEKVPFLDGLCEKSPKEAEGLINDYLAKNAWKPKTYYDYAKKKLDIAKKIGLIPQ